MAVPAAPRLQRGDAQSTPRSPSPHDITPPEQQRRRRQRTRTSPSLAASSCWRRIERLAQRWRLRSHVRVEFRHALESGVRTTSPARTRDLSFRRGEHGAGARAADVHGCTNAERRCCTWMCEWRGAQGCAGAAMRASGPSGEVNMVRARERCQPLPWERVGVGASECRQRELDALARAISKHSLSLRERVGVRAACRPRRSPANACIYIYMCGSMGGGRLKFGKRSIGRRRCKTTRIRCAQDLPGSDRRSVEIRTVNRIASRL